MGMIRSKRLNGDGQRALVKRLGEPEPAERLINQADIDKGDGQKRVRRIEGPLLNGEAALEQGLRRIGIACILIDSSEVVQGLRHLGVVPASRFDADGQASPQHRPGFRIPAFVVIEHAEIAERLSGLGVLGTVGFFVDRQTALQDRLGGVELAVFQIGIAKAAEHHGGNGAVRSEPALRLSQRALANRGGLGIVPIMRKLAYLPVETYDLVGLRRLREGGR